MSDIIHFPQYPPNEPFPRFIAVANPAAGAEIDYNCPTGYRMKILGISFTLIGAVAAANRNVDVTISQGARELYRFDANVIQIALTNWEYFVVPGQIQATFTAGFQRWIPAPSPLFLFNGQTIATDTTLLQAGDQFTLTRIYAMVWPDFVNLPPATL